MTYSLFCGDTYVCSVDYDAQLPGVLSKKESDEILQKAKLTNDYKKFNNWIGFGYLTIKLNAY